MAREISNLHDASIDGIMIGESTARVFLRKSTGEQHTLTLFGLEALHMKAFRQSNTICMIEIVSGRAPYEHTGIKRLSDRLIPPQPRTFVQRMRRF